MTAHPAIEAPTRILTLAEFESETLPQLRPQPVTAYGRITWRDLDRPSKELEYLVDDWLTVGGKSILGGPSGSGKSFLAVDIALAIATKRDWFGNEILAPGLVIYQAGEGGLGLKKRFRAYRSHFGLVDPDIPFEFLPHRIDIFAPDNGGGDTAKLIAAINGIAAEYEGRAELRAVFIDTLATAQGGADEISGKDMAIVLSNVDRISRQTGAHVCLVHHMNADGKKLRGHTSVKANIDEVILISKNEQTNVRTAVLDKLKDGEDGKKFQFELMSVEVGQRASDGKRITSCVCLPVGAKEAIRKEETLKGYRLNEGEILFMEALFEATKRFGMAVPATWDIADSVRAIVKYEDVKRTYAAKSPDDTIIDAAVSDEDRAAARERHREALKKRLFRARKYLSSDRVGILGSQDEFVWWTGRPLRAFPHTLPAVPHAQSAAAPEEPGDLSGEFPGIDF